MSLEHESDARALVRRRHQRELQQARERCERELEAIVDGGPSAHERVLQLERSARRTRVGVTAVSFGIAALIGLSLSAQAGDEDHGVFGTLIARSATLDALTLRGPLRIVDSSGRSLAFLGREGDPAGSGPVVLGLSATPEGEQTLRLATSDSGAAVSARTSDGDASIMLLARGSGPEIELRDGARTRVVSEESGADALPQVAAGGSQGSSAIDLQDASAQAIGHGFIVVGLATEQRADGAWVRGRVINSNSVRHDDVKLRLGANGAAAVFEISRISPGNSTGFEARLEGTEAESLGRGRLEYLGSTVSYHAHRTRGHRAELSASGR